MAECFVIQPFDNGKFDRRYSETFLPAIEEAGLVPYRVDKDPAVTDLVEGIKDGIDRASAILADVTMDNPNVWYELGYALARAKPFCIICSSERVGSYPFDVSKLKILPYDTGSASDFETLQASISERLRAVASESAQLKALSLRITRNTTNEDALTPFESAVLLSIFEEHLSGGVTSWSLIQKMDSVGFTKAAATLGVVTLRDKGLVAEEIIERFNEEPYQAYVMTQKGLRLVQRDPECIGLAVTRPRVGSKAIEEDEIPF